MAQLSLLLRIARLFVFTNRRDESSNANNITLFKKQFYKHKQSLYHEILVFRNSLNVLSNSCSADHFHEFLPFIVMLLQNIFVWRYQRVVCRIMYCCFEKFWKSVSAKSQVIIMELLKYEFPQTNIQKRINLYYLGVFQYCFFGTMKSCAFKLFIKILLAEIFENVNQYIIPAVINK